MNKEPAFIDSKSNIFSIDRNDHLHFIFRISFCLAESFHKWNVSISFDTAYSNVIHLFNFDCGFVGIETHCFQIGIFTYFN